MKTEYKIISAIFAFMIVFGVCAFIGVKLQKPVYVPTFSAVDSIAIDSIKNRIDTIKILETVWRTKIKTVRETDTVVYAGTDTTCLEIIERKNRLIEGLDSLTLALDEEARLYSDLNVVYLKRNEALSDSIGSVKRFYEDSLNSVKERLYSGFFKRNHKWNRNEFRKYVMTK